MGRKLVWRCRIGKAAGGWLPPIPQNIFGIGAWGYPPLQQGGEGAHLRCGSIAFQKKQTRATGPGLLEQIRTRLREQACLAEPSADAPTPSQAAGLNSFDALVLIGSMVSEAIFCPSSPNSLA